MSTVKFPAPVGRVDLLIIAGEHSGDEHAGRMTAELRRAHPELTVAAIGGPKLAAAGAQLLFDLTASSAMGFAVLGRLSFYRDLIEETVRWVDAQRPRAVCFVDSSGLNLRIARQLFARGISAKAGGPTKTLYYISPQVWASRPNRRFAMARHLDALAAIFPFEPRVYADTGLSVTFVGHPFLAPDYVPPVRFDPNGPVLLLPGSRQSVVARVFPVLLEAFRRWGGKRDAVVLYPSDEILAVIQRSSLPANVRGMKTGSGTAAIPAAAALTTSGTMSMHCALAGIPGAVIYRTDPLTYALGRLLVTVDFIGIANLLLGEPMYPEFIQSTAKPDALAAELRACLEDPARRARSAEQSSRLRQLLSQPADQSAAEWIARQISPRVG